MSDKKIESGAASAIAEHTKDASVAGANPAASATGKEGVGTRAIPGEGSDTVTRLSEQARDAASRFATSVSDAADQVHQQISGKGRGAAQQAAGIVRQQPVTALLAAAAVGMILGVLMGWRRD